MIDISREAVEAIQKKLARYAGNVCISTSLEIDAASALGTLRSALETSKALHAETALIASESLKREFAAMSKLAAAEARVKVLEEALLPLSEYPAYVPMSDHQIIQDDATCNVSYGVIRRACEALETKL
jgi:hypothetical protein